LGFSHTFIVRPPSLIRKNAKRWTETVSIYIIKAFNSIGLLRGMTPVPTMSVARQMLEGAKTIKVKLITVDAKEIVKYSKQHVFIG